MKDRVPGAPGQHKATVSAADLQKMQAGEQFAITLTRDDQPIVDGTPYSKATVLPDKVAAQFCQDIEDPTPADVFAAIGASLEGKAPAGFGLGTASKYASDLNTCLVNGWYYVRQNTENIPAGFDYGSVFVTDRNIEGAPEQVVQVLYAFYNSAIDGTLSANCMLIRSTNNGGKTWRERWVNPPFAVGVEYVTIEERQGRAVVKKLDTDGLLKYRLEGTSSWKTYAQEVGAAPAGYGLGTTAVALPEDNLNKALSNGWYWATKESCKAAGLPDDMEYAVVLVKNRFDGVVVQELTSIGTASAGFLHTVGCQLVRYTADGGNTWIDEWVNPPMKPGVEYRTTERCNSKAVYKKLDASGNVLWRTEGEEAWHVESGVSCIEASNLKHYLDSRTFDADETIMLSGVCDARVLLGRDKANMTYEGTEWVENIKKNVSKYSSVRKIKSLTLDGANNATMHGFDFLSGKVLFGDGEGATVENGRVYYVTTSYDIDTLVFKNMTFTDHVDIEDKDGKTNVRNVVFENVTFLDSGNMSDHSCFIKLESDYNTIKSVVIRNCTFNGGAVSRLVYALCYADTDMNITIENCVFDGSSWNAIQLIGSGTYSGNIRIHNNTVFDVYEVAVQLLNVSGRLTICGNTFVDVNTGTPWGQDELNLDVIRFNNQNGVYFSIANNVLSNIGVTTSRFEVAPSSVPSAGDTAIAAIYPQS